jgi:aminopeptidase N
MHRSIVTSSPPLHRLALFALASLCLAPAAVADQPGRLGDAVVPTRQRIALRVDPDRPAYSGSVEVAVSVRRPTPEIRFYAEDLALGRVELVAGSERFSLTTRTAERGLVVATAANDLAPGDYTLEIDFTGTLGSRAVGLYRAEQGGRGYVFSQLEAIDARRAFPCWDEPAYKIPYQLELTVPAGQTAVHNTPVETTTESGGWQTVKFAATPPLPSYLLAIAVGPFDSVPIVGLSVPGRIYTVAGKRGLAGEAVALTPPILAALERYFGRPYPYSKLDLIAVPDYWPGAMENPGAITFADHVLLIDPRAPSVAQRRTLVHIAAHELAHMWFGDLVTMRWWDDLWLNESFADWMGNKITDELYPELGWELASLREVEQVMAGDARPNSPPVHRPVTDDSLAMEGLQLVYAKGRAVLAMVEGWVGSEAFRKGVLDYLAAHAWGNATAGDLWSSLSQASGTDVAGALRTFVDQPGMPWVDVEVEDGGRVRIRQRRFLNFGVTAPAQSWEVPVVLKFRDAEGIKTRTLVLTEASREISLGAADDPLGWVMPDAGARGYYRWQIPRPMLLALAAKSTAELTPRERVAFLGNAGALLDAGALGGDDYLQVLNAFAGDPEPEVVSALLDGLSKVELAFVPDDRRPAFAGYVRATLAPALTRFGLAATAGEPEAVALFRPRLIGWLGEQGRDPQVQTYAVKLARAYLADPGSVDPSLAGVSLELAAHDGDRALFDDYRRRFERSEIPADRGRYLAALGSFAQPELQEEALAYALSGPLRPNELFTIARKVAIDEAGRQRLYRWATDHFADIAARIPPDFVVYLPFVASGCSTDRLARARDFFGAPERRVDGTDRQLVRIADQVNDCASLRRREGQAVAEYLGRFDRRNGGRE